MFADRTAVVDHDRRLTYREFHERARSMAAGLEAIGIQPGDRVAFLALNGEALLTAHFGVPMSGAVLVAINTRLARNEFVYILNHSEAAALVVDPALLPDFNELRGESLNRFWAVDRTGVIRSTTRSGTSSSSGPR